MLYIVFYLVNEFPDKVDVLKDQLLIYLITNNLRHLKSKFFVELRYYLHVCTLYCRDARTISINVKTYIFLVYQLELTKTEILSPHL